MLLKRIQKKRSPIIQRLSHFLVGDPGVLDGVGRIGVAELKDKKLLFLQ